MWNRNFYFILLFCLFISQSVIAEDKKIQFLEWKSISGANAYRVEVKNEKNKIVFSKDTEKNRIEFELGAGKYFSRIGVLNKFGRVSVFSKWSPMNVIIARSPEPVLKKKIFLNAGAEPLRVVLQGKNLFEEMNVRAVRGNETLPVEVLEWKSDKEVVLQINPKDAKPGLYDLILENPKKRITKIPSYVLVAAEKSKAKEEDLVFNNQTAEHQNQSGQNSIGGPNQEVGRPDKYFWSVLWRSTVIPGWGYREADYKKTGYLTSIAFFGLVANAMEKKRNWDREKRIYSEKNKMNFLTTYGGELTQTPSFNFYTTPLAGYWVDKRDAEHLRHYQKQYNASLLQLGGFYLFQMLHSAYLARNFNYWHLEMVWYQKAALVPGAMFFMEEKTAWGVAHSITFAGALYYWAEKQQDWQRNNAVTKDRETRTMIAFSPYFTNIPIQYKLASLIYREGVEGKRKESQEKYKYAGGILAGVYLIQVVHAMVVGYQSFKTRNVSKGDGDGKINFEGASLTFLPGIRSPGSDGAPKLENSWSGALQFSF